MQQYLFLKISTYRAWFWANFTSLAAQEFVMATSGATSYEDFYKMTTYLLRYGFILRYFTKFVI